MALQGFIMPSINGVLNFKDFSNQLVNSNAGNKEAVNIVLDQINRAKDRSFKKEEGEIDRGWRADENQIERNWREAQEKKRQDWEESRDTWRWNMENEKKKNLLKTNLDYALNMAYDPTNKGSIIQAQNNLMKALQDAKAAGYTMEELASYDDKLKTLEKDMEEYQKKADFKQTHDNARSRIIESINAGASDTAMDIILDNADLFDKAELDEFQKRIEAQKRKEYRERYNEGRQYEKDRKEDSQDAFGARIMGG